MDYLDKRGVRPDFVLDEGGSLIPEGLPGIRSLSAVVGVAEKGTADYRVYIEDGSGGHASVPPRSTVAGRIARAAREIESHPFPGRLSTSVKMMFRELGDKVPPYMAPFFRHPDLASPAICAASSLLGGTFRAMAHTTAAVTMIKSGTACNVLPESAEMMVNVRLLEGDTTMSVLTHLRGVITDPGVKVELVSGTNPTGISPIDCDAFLTLKDVILKTWPGAVVSPYQMNGGTDARFFEKLTDHIYRFTPMIMTKEERASVHGRDESVSKEALCHMIAFYIRLIMRL